MVPRLTIFALLPLGSLQALAQGAAPDQNALFSGYINSASYKGYLEQAFNLGESKTLKSQCATLKVLEHNRTIVLEQPVFVRAGANYNVESGAWIALATLDRCGTSVTRRAHLKAIPGKNQLHPTFLLPGEFRGNLKLEADAMQIVGPGLMGTAKCQDRTTFQVLDVKALTAASPSGWSEMWTAEACGTTVEAQVTYTATGTGMNITASKLRVP